MPDRKGEHGSPDPGSTGGVYHGGAAVQSSSGTISSSSRLMTPVQPV